MQKIIKIGNKVIVFLENGNCVEGVVSEDTFKKIFEATSEEEVVRLLCPEYDAILSQREEALSIVEKLRKSNILRVKNDTIYWDSVSSLSVPQELADAVVNAELENNSLKLTTYKNFWTLMSLNPDDRCRKNLFWFLQKYGMTLAKCGFFVGYRNVDTTGIKDVFTDHHSHSFKIKIGEMVTMPRDKCDTVQENTCSTGLRCSPLY